MVTIARHSHSAACLDPALCLDVSLGMYPPSDFAGPNDPGAAAVTSRLAAVDSVLIGPSPVGECGSRAAKSATPTGAASESQQVLMGADGITYRTLDEVDVHERDVPGPRRPGGAPDPEERVDAQLLHIDLVTGARHEFSLTAPQSVVIHAWSPGGRYVAFGESDWNEQRPDYARAQAVRTGGTFVLLDLVAGTQTPLTQVGPIAAAAFSPDSTRLAVQLGDTCQTGAAMAATNLLPQMRVLPAATLSHDNTTLRWAIAGAIVLVGALWFWFWFWLSIRRRGPRQRKSMASGPR